LSAKSETTADFQPVVMEDDSAVSSDVDKLNEGSFGLVDGIESAVTRVDERQNPSNWAI
jgi:hypothetical protein